MGCAAEPDRLEHYLACETFWGIVSNATGHQAATDVLENLCIVAPSRTNLRNLLVAHGLYHTLKQGYLEKVRTAGASNGWGPLLDLAAEIAGVSADRWPLRPLCGCTGGRISESLHSESRGLASPPEMPAVPDYCEDRGSWATAGVAALPVPPRLRNSAADDYCEPECSEVALGAHHPNCVLFLLQEP